MKYKELVTVKQIINDWAKREQLGAVCINRLKNKIDENIIPDDIENYNPRLFRTMQNITFCKVCGMPIWLHFTAKKKISYDKTQ